jgi:2-haloacid dehalogenase
VTKTEEYLIFDTFGTLLDWKGSIVSQIACVAGNRLDEVKRVLFAERWARGYGAETAAVVRGEKPFRPLSQILDGLFSECEAEYGFPFDVRLRDELRTVWERLEPWGDVLPGMKRLRDKYRLVSFTNADVRMITKMAAHASLPFDVLFSAEEAQAYKPDPRIYRKLIDHLGCSPSRITLVASHTFDLKRRRRPRHQHRPGAQKQEPGGDVMDMRRPLDWLAYDLGDLADQML